MSIAENINLQRNKNVRNIAVLRASMIFSLAAFSIACLGSAPIKGGESIAEKTFQSHCLTAGEKITETVDNVDGILLVKIRPNGINFGDQFKLDDPYGSDVEGDGYIETFLRASYDLRLMDKTVRTKAIRANRPTGYSYVDVIGDEDGIHYRYTGDLEEPWQYNKNYLKGYFRSVLHKERSYSDLPRYGVTYDDISTSRDRELWIAGSSLKVVDLHTNKVIGERIGYMFDPSQGSTAGGRSPWLLASRNACPAFGQGHSSSSQLYQTIKFVEKVLHPKMVK